MKKILPPILLPAYPRDIFSHRDNKKAAAKKIDKPEAGIKNQKRRAGKGRYRGGS